MRASGGGNESPACEDLMSFVGVVDNALDWTSQFATPVFPEEPPPSQPKQLLTPGSSPDMLPSAPEPSNAQAQSRVSTLLQCKGVETSTSEPASSLAAGGRWASAVEPPFAGGEQAALLSSHAIPIYPAVGRSGSSKEYSPENIRGSSVPPTLQPLAYSEAAHPPAAAPSPPAAFCAPLSLHSSQRAVKPVSTARAPRHVPSWQKAAAAAAVQTAWRQTRQARLGAKRLCSDEEVGAYEREKVKSERETAEAGMERSTTEASPSARAGTPDWLKTAEALLATSEGMETLGNEGGGDADVIKTLAHGFDSVEDGSASSAAIPACSSSAMEADSVNRDPERMVSEEDVNNSGDVERNIYDESQKGERGEEESELPVEEEAREQENRRCLDGKKEVSESETQVGEADSEIEDAEKREIGFAKTGEDGVAMEQEVGETENREEVDAEEGGIGCAEKGEGGNAVEREVGDASSRADGDAEWEAGDVEKIEDRDTKQTEVRDAEDREVRDPEEETEDAEAAAAERELELEFLSMAAESIQAAWRRQRRCHAEFKPQPAALESGALRMERVVAMCPSQDELTGHEAECDDSIASGKRAAEGVGSFHLSEGGEMAGSRLANEGKEGVEVAGSSAPHEGGSDPAACASASGADVPEHEIASESEPPFATASSSDAQLLAFFEPRGSLFLEQPAASQGDSESEGAQLSSPHCAEGGSFTREGLAQPVLSCPPESKEPAAATSDNQAEERLSAGDASSPAIPTTAIADESARLDDLSSSGSQAGESVDGSERTSASQRQEKRLASRAEARAQREVQRQRLVALQQQRRELLAQQRREKARSAQVAQAATLADLKAKMGEDSAVTDQQQPDEMSPRTRLRYLSELQAANEQDASSAAVMDAPAELTAQAAVIAGSSSFPPLPNITPPVPTITPYLPNVTPPLPDTTVPSYAAPVDGVGYDSSPHTPAEQNSNEEDHTLLSAHLHSALPSAPPHPTQWEEATPAADGPGASPAGGVWTQATNFLRGWGNRPRQARAAGTTSSEQPSEEEQMRW